MRSEQVTVRLEPWGPGLLPLLEQTMGDADMTRYLGGPEDAAKLADRQAKYERLADSGEGRMFAIVDARSGEPIGSVGYWDKEWQGEGVYETGWFVLPGFQGRGIAASGTLMAMRKAKAGRQAPVRSCLSLDREPRIERDLQEARVHAAGGARVRVPAGTLHEV